MQNPSSEPIQPQDDEAEGPRPGEDLFPDEDPDVVGLLRREEEQDAAENDELENVLAVIPDELSREELVEQTTAALVAEGSGPVAAGLLAEMYATMLEFRVMVDGLQSNIVGGGMFAKLLGFARNKE